MIGNEIQELDEGRMRVAADFLPHLQRNRLDTVDSVMGQSGGEPMRTVPGRSTVRLELVASTGETAAVYLKRFDPACLSPTHLLRRLMRWPGADDEALREWRKIFSLRQHGFLTARPIAVGQSRRLGVVTHSFLITQEIAGGIPADRYFAEHLQGAPARRKWRWLSEVGELVRRFQETRFIHKDLYLSHIFVAEEGEGWRFYLIDLQRVRGPHWHWPRWYVKDLVSLAFSARALARCSRTDLLRIYKSLAPTENLTSADKQRIKKIWRRAQRLEQRPPKYRRIWNQPSATPAG